MRMVLRNRRLAQTETSRSAAGWPSGPAPRAPSPGAHFAVEAVGEHAGAAVRAGVDPSSPETLVVIERVEGMSPDGGGDRAQVAECIGAFTDLRVFRYEQVGLRPKTVARPLRFQQVRRRLELRPDRLADIAADCG